LLPKHALQGEDFNKVWINDLNNPKTGKPIASGPFMFANWTKGQTLTIVRNPNWWGPHKAYLDKIVFKFVTDTNSEIQAIRGGDGIWSCQGKRMSYAFVTTAGNKLRELAFEIFQAQAKNAGIELTSALAPARIAFGPTVFEAGNFHMFMYAWVGTGDPQGWNSIYNVG